MADGKGAPGTTSPDIPSWSRKVGALLHGAEEAAIPKLGNYKREEIVEAAETAASKMCTRERGTLILRPRRGYLALIVTSSAPSHIVDVGTRLRGNACR